MCLDCQIRVKDQLFCSKRCHTLFQIKNIWLRSQQALFRHNLYLRAKTEHLNRYSTFILIILVVAAGAISLYSATTEERYTPSLYGHSMSKEASSPAAPPAVGSAKPLGKPLGADKPLSAKEHKFSSARPSVGWAKMDLRTEPERNSIGGLADAEEICSNFHIYLAQNRVKQPYYLVDICGNAPPNSIIALYKNDRLCDTVPCKGERFLFPRIGLDRNRNILQAKLITADGKLCYSNTLELLVDKASSQVTEKGLDIKRGDINMAKICLSFDSGENADAAPLILDILKEKQVRTTIFLTGEFIRRNPNIVKRIVEEGHEVGNHTDTHPHLTTRSEGGRLVKCLPGVDREFLHRELKKAEEAFYHLTGKHMSHYWRAPYGETNLEIRKWAEELGYIHVSWTCGRDWEDGLDSLDWVTDPSSGRYHTAEQIRNQIINFGQGTEFGANGGIVLMHFSTYRPHQDKVYLQLPEIIAGLRAKGYEIVPISQLLEGKGIDSNRWAKKGRLRQAGR